MVRSKDLPYKLILNTANYLERTGYMEKVPRRAIKGDNQSIHERIATASGWSERDEIVRDLASLCLLQADEAAKQGDQKNQQKWLDLLQRFLRLSLHYRKEYDLDELRQKLAEIDKHHRSLYGDDKR